MARGDWRTALCCAHAGRDACHWSDALRECEYLLGAFSGGINHDG